MCQSLTFTEKLSVVSLIWHAHATKAKTTNIKETKTNERKQAKSGQSQRAVKTVQMEPERLWRKGFVEQTRRKICLHPGENLLLNVGN